LTTDTGKINLNIEQATTIKNACEKWIENPDKFCNLWDQEKGDELPQSTFLEELFANYKLYDVYKPLVSQIIVHLSFVTQKCNF